MSERIRKQANLRKNKQVTFSNLRVIESLPLNFMQWLRDPGLRKMLAPMVLFFLVTTAFASTPDKAWVDKTLRALTLKEKIAQLVQIRVPGKFINHRSTEFEVIKDQILQNRVGGLVLFAGNIYESAILLNELQTISKLPLLVAADFERGASFRIADTTSFPWAMALGATGNDRFAYQQGLITGQESRALGVHWIFAPVMDVNNNPDNPVINIRSFGEDPKLVARMGSAFIRGARNAGVLTTAKHFPGHGDTTTDSHISLPVVESDISRLESVEFEPFRSAVEAGVDSIMTAHVAVPQVTNEPDVPATLSPKILSDLLRNTLGFRGLVVTDALEMAGITNRYWCGLAAIRAIQAGADVLLLPPNAAIAINEVERAVKLGIISETRIEQSARKILEAKSRMGLPQNRHASLRQIGRIVSLPHNVQLAQEIADCSITVVRDEQHLLPINALNDTRIFSLALTSDLESSPASLFQTEMRRRFPSLRTAWANARISDELLADIDTAISEADVIVCSLWSRLVTGQSVPSASENHRAIQAKLLASGKPLIWVAFGNPYVLRQFPEAGTYLCAFSYSDVSQIAAAKALSGEISVAGKMPVSIPGFSKIGDGFFIPKFEMVLKPAAPEIIKTTQNAFENTKRLLMSTVEAGELPGAQLLVGHQGTIVLNINAGKLNPSAESAIVTSSTIYNLDSLSRLVGNASAAMMAIESGSLIPEAPIKDYLHEIEGTELEALRIRDLLKASSDRDAKGLNESTAVMEKAVARASGVSYSRFLSGHLFEPLGMKSTFHSPPKNYPGGIARFNPSSGSTLFCNAYDLAAFAQMLLNRGIYRHQRYFRPETVMKYTGPHGLWSKPSDSDWTGSLFSSSAFGHSSSKGSLLWIDPARKMFLVLLTNPGQESERIGKIQRMISESVVSSIDGLNLTIKQ
jgi:beta-N-acetylhexosaminidase